MAYQHIPVMLAEIISMIKPQPGQIIVDCTLGGAGYTLALAKLVGPTGRILAIDLDEGALTNATDRLTAAGLNNVILIKDNFRNLKEIVKDNFPDNTKLDGVVMDLGLSSAQLDDERRGFSFKSDRPLDMAFSLDGQLAVATSTIVNRYSLTDLTKVLRDYGEEPKAYFIAKKIIEARKVKRIKTTADLLAIIQSVAKPNSRMRINPATKTFQALRMETNQELESLKIVLPAALEALKISGRLATVSFHSGEDRIVKDFFKTESRDCLCPPAAPVCVCGHQARLKILTKKPLIPTETESRDNPRARSAKLRAAEKIR
jgi:16S rRNA (cytosine1402-N4)-methyltransferase